MAPVEEMDVSMARLEGKVDTLAAEVRAGDKQSGQLIELVKQQLIYLQQSLDDLKTLLAAERRHTDAATSAVRVDLERQIARLEQAVDEKLLTLAETSAAHGKRLEMLEVAYQRQQGAMKVLAVVGGFAVTVVAPVVTAVLLRNMS